MNNSQHYNRLLTLFHSKYLKGHNNLKGLILNTSINDDGNNIIDISNPNDLSYVSTSVVRHVEELVYDFVKFTNNSHSNFSDNSEYEFITNSLFIFIDGQYVKNITEVYLSKQDLSEIMSRCNTIHEYEFNEFSSRCKVDFVEANTESSDGINVELKVTLLTPEWEGQPIRNIGILEDKLREILDDDGAIDYEEEFTRPIMDIFWNNPLIIYNEYMWASSELYFYTTSGKSIRPWK